ncbi:MAG: prephenate dehydrogenase/arogenate dehydrogenase family protein [Betaproteobacteria bacterium]|nr:prephenate dehydrogenase/arogenate dehydrogenase family protein [Betaproteobacteria bacterium]
MSGLRIEKLVVIGVGLIGGSFALALQKARVVKHVVGVGRTRKNLNVALKLGVIDEISHDAAQAVRDADLVLIGTPVGQMPAVMKAIAPHLGAKTIVTDGGSTKQDVIACARKYLGAHFTRFVPAHPMAGTEHSGAAAAFAELYRGRKVILVPQRETEAKALALVRAAWLACGANVVRLKPREHDEILAHVSHLPHVVAFALMHTLARRKDAKRVLGFSAGGLRDTVRIAGSSPEMWRDIFLANRLELLAAIDKYINEIKYLRKSLAARDGAAMQALFEGARDARERWLVGAKRPVQRPAQRPTQRR